MTLERPRGGPLAVVERHGSLGRFADLLEAAHPHNTRRAYRADWSHFVAFAEGADLDRLPFSARAADCPPFNPCPARADRVAYYIGALSRAGFAPSTIDRRLATISKKHRSEGVPSPTAEEVVRRMRAGILATVDGKRRKKAALLLPELSAIVLGMGTTPIDLRDRALFLLGWAGGLRRSELAAVEVGHLDFVPEGLWLHLPRRKTDQEGKGTDIPIPLGAHAVTCPVGAVRAWLEAAGLEAGPGGGRGRQGGAVLEGGIGGKCVCRVVKKHVARLGLDPATFGGHSFRAGFITEALAQGAPETAVQRISGHASLDQLSTYNRRRDYFKDHPALVAGL